MDLLVFAAIVGAIYGCLLFFDSFFKVRCCTVIPINQCESFE